MNELNKKLAEWAGFRIWQNVVHDGNQVCRISTKVDCPDGTTRMLPNFPESLDSCFKHLVPKYISILMESVNEQTAYEMLFYKWLRFGYDAPALCKAIEELIKDN